MLDENILVQDLNPRHWTRLLKLFSNQKKSRSVLFLVVEQGVCLKALHLEKGAIMDFDYGSGDLKTFAEREKVDFVARVDRNFFQRAFLAAQKDVHYDEDYVTQLTSIFNGALDHSVQNIEWYPHRPSKLKMLNPRRMQKIFNLFFPDDHTLLFCITHKGAPYTSLILGKRSGKLALMTSLEAIERAEAPFDSAEDLPAITESIRDLFAPVFLSILIEKDCFKEMLAGKRPLTFLRGAMKHERALFYPFSLKLKLALWAARVFRGL